MNNIIRRTWKQGGLVNIEDLRGSAFQAEEGGHTFLISGVDENGEALALSGTPAGVLLRSDGQDVALTCSVSDGVVSATLPANAYVVPGRIGITIFLTNNGQKVAIYAAVGSVATTSSGTVAPPAGSDVVDLVNAIAAAVASIPASATNLMAAIAPTYSNTALYAVGQYAWYDGVLKRCIVPITTAESYTAAHWTNANLGGDVTDLKSAFNAKINSGNEYIVGKKNLLDNVEWTNGYYISDSDGSYVEGQYFRYSSLIPVSQGINTLIGYVANTNSYVKIHGYNSSGVWQGNIFAQATGQVSKTIAMYFSVNNSNITQIRLSIIVSPYYEPFYIIEGNQTIEDEIESIKNDIDNEIPVDELNYADTANIYAKSNINGYYNMSTGQYVEYSEGAARGYICTDLFRVMPGVKLTRVTTISDGNFFFYFNRDKEYITYADGGSAQIVPASAYYCSFEYLYSHYAETVQIQMDSTKVLTVYPKDFDDSVINAFTGDGWTDLNVTFPNEDYYITSGGSLVSYADCNVSNAINIPDSKYNRFIRVTGYKFYQGVVVVFFASNGSVISYFPQTSDSVKVMQNEVILVPANAKTMKIGDNSAKTTAISSTKVEYATSLAPQIDVSSLATQLFENRWAGKKWACVGDSLTAVNDRATKRYYDYISEKTGISIVNMGYSGSGYARTPTGTTGKEFYNRISSVPTDSDVVTIFGSFNDFQTGYDLGTVTDSGTTTIAGCINKTLDNLFTAFPLAIVGIVTPTPWESYNPLAEPNVASNYVDMLIAICKRRSIPCLDLFHESLLRPWEASFRQLAYTHDDGNGTHPDETGHAMIAPRFEAFVDKLLLH